MDSIKKDLPTSEWVKLGDSTEPYNDYAKDEFGSYILDSDGNYEMIQKRDFRANEAAIPNLLDRIYNSKGLDSTNFCEKIEVLNNCLDPFMPLGKEFSDKAVVNLFYSLIQKISNKKVKNIDVHNISVFWWDIIISFSKKIK
jgi:hypothetical protein